MFCNQCGKGLNNSDIPRSSFVLHEGVASETPSTTQSGKSTSYVASLPTAAVIGFLLIVNGAVVMLIAMALDWYTVYKGEVFFLSFTQLNKSYSMDYYGLNWFGAALPLILIIVFASVVILFAVYSLLTGQLYKKFWGLLGLLSIVALIANLIYMLMDGIFYKFPHGANATYDVRPHIGWAIALIGAIAISIGAIVIGLGNKNRPFPKIALLPKAVAQIPLLPRGIARGFLIMILGAVMMLISLTLDWYSVYTDMDEHILLKFDFQHSWRWLTWSGLHWSGTTMPLILMTVFASTVILSTIYSLATGRYFNKLWGLLSLFSAVTIIGNFLYFLVYYWNHGYVEYFIPYIGWWLAFIGAIAIGIGGYSHRYWRYNNRG